MGSLGPLRFVAPAVVGVAGRPGRVRRTGRMSTVDVLCLAWTITAIALSIGIAA
jgi:hypothetical protein